MPTFLHTPKQRGEASVEVTCVIQMTIKGLRRRLPGKPTLRFGDQSYLGHPVLASKHRPQLQWWAVPLASELGLSAAVFPEARQTAAKLYLLMKLLDAN